MTYRAYAGIGSRQTPRPILKFMEQLAAQLAERRWTLRTGHAPGADQAFERGAGHRAEVYLPWPRFEPHVPLLARTVVDTPTGEALELSSQHHPHWEHLKQGERMLHGRNAHQVLGLYLNEPVAFVVAWTEQAAGGGGTGQALRIARAYEIPVYDLADPGVLGRVSRSLEQVAA